MAKASSFSKISAGEGTEKPEASAAVRDGLRPPGDCVPNALSSNFRVGSHPMIWQKKTPEPAVNL